MRAGSTLRALDAYKTGVHRPPVNKSDDGAWGGISFCQWQLPWLDGFEVAENDDFSIALHSAGSRKVRAACNGPWSESTSTPGLISVIPPGRKVEYRIDGEVEFSTIHLPRRLVDSFVGSRFPGEPDFRFAFQDNFATACFDALLNEARAGIDCNFPYINALTRALVLHLMKSFRKAPVSNDVQTGSGDARPGLDAILNYIDSNLMTPPSLKQLADRAEASRSHFVRRFRAETGMPPHRYINFRRVEKAKELLSSTRSGLADIALEVGFANQSHFTQVFHAMTGRTPSQFRRENDI